MSNKGKRIDTFVAGPAPIARRSNPPARPATSISARCIACGRLTTPDDVGAGIEGFTCLCICRRCDRENQQGILALGDAI